MGNGRTADEPWSDLELIERAATYATRLHRDDLRKGSTVPYQAHLWSVAALVLEHGGDDVQVAAAFLHDVVEDHGGRPRLEEVRSNFGPEVASLVEALSDSLEDTEAGQQKRRWADRKREYLDKLAAEGPEVQLVSACDKLHNARCMLADHRAIGRELWERFTVPDPVDHLWYYQSLVSIYEEAAIPQGLSSELRRTVDALTDEVRSYEPAVDERLDSVLAGADRLC